MEKVSDRSVLYEESRVTNNQQCHSSDSSPYGVTLHNDHTDRLNLVDVANEFIANNKHRRQVFGLNLRKRICRDYCTGII